MVPEPITQTSPYAPTGRVDTDGRAIYTRTFNFAALPNATIATFATGLPATGPAALVNFRNQFGSANRGSTQDQIPLPYPHANGAPIGCSMVISAGLWVIRVDTGSTDYSGFAWQYVLEFTTLAG